MRLYEVTTEEVISAMAMPEEQANIVTAELAEAYEPVREFIPNLAPDQGHRTTGRPETTAIASGVVSALRLRLVSSDERRQTVEYRIAPRIVDAEGFAYRSLALWVRRPEDDNR
jgi:hypothetical protein